MKIAILDDEKEQTDLLAEYIRRYAKEKGLDISAQAFHDANDFLDHYTPGYDMALLDIEMPGILNGMEAAKELRKADSRIVIMFITNMAQYAIEGYEVQAVDFILKPLCYIEFSLKFTKALRYVERNRDKKILIRTVDGPVYLSVSDIYYVEVINHSLIYHTSLGEFEIRGSMKTAEEELREFPFFRCSNSYLIHLKYVEALRGNTVEVAGTPLPVSRSKKAEFLQRFNLYVGGMKG